MPLNIEDTGRDAQTGPGAPNRQPEPPGPKRLYPWILLILVIASGVFLLFQFGLLPPGKKRGEPVSTSSRVTPAAPVITPAPDTAVHVRVPPEMEVPPPAADSDANPPAAEGNYTIVISAFSSAADAGEMADRWSNAGFPAEVRNAGGWYRVTLGRYRTVPDARREADSLKEALEVGYWITRIDM